MKDGRNAESKKTKRLCRDKNNSIAKILWYNKSTYSYEQYNRRLSSPSLFVALFLSLSFSFLSLLFALYPSLSLSLSIFLLLSLCFFLFVCLSSLSLSLSVYTFHLNLKKSLTCSDRRESLFVLTVRKFVALLYEFPGIILTVHCIWSPLDILNWWWLTGPPPWGKFGEYNPL